MAPVIILSSEIAIFLDDPDLIKAAFPLAYEKLKKISNFSASFWMEQTLENACKFDKKLIWLTYFDNLHIVTSLKKLDKITEILNVYKTNIVNNKHYFNAFGIDFFQLPVVSIDKNNTKNHIGKLEDFIHFKNDIYQIFLSDNQHRRKTITRQYKQDIALLTQELNNPEYYYLQSTTINIPKVKEIETLVFKSIDSLQKSRNRKEILEILTDFTEGNSLLGGNMTLGRKGSSKSAHFGRMTTFIDKTLPSENKDWVSFNTNFSPIKNIFIENHYSVRKDTKHNTAILAHFKINTDLEDTIVPTELKIMFWGHDESCMDRVNMLEPYINILTLFVTLASNKTEKRKNRHTANFSRRQKEVLMWKLEGMDENNIADIIGISTAWVKILTRHLKKDVVVKNILANLAD